MNRPVVAMIMAMSVDGYITKHQDALVDWTSKEDKKLFVQLTKEAGALIYGRKTFSFHNKPLPKRLNIIITRQPKQHKNIPNELEFTNQAPYRLLEDLGRRGYKKVFVAGGPEINALFVKDGLVDELYITVEPYLFGNGKRLLSEMNISLPLELIDTQHINPHTVVLHYRVKR